ncbi:MAG: inositol monophosphatase, partial [Jatrophihabitantaceae bacterium]
MTDDLALAAELVREAGQLAARMLVEGLQSVRKSSVSDVVSAADHAAEELVQARLREHRPADAVIGEEGAQVAGADPSGARTWYIDPVDGTYNFLAGIPFWCSALALAGGPDQPVTNVPLAGAVYIPVTDELWLGSLDHPTSVNGQPVARLVDRPLAELAVGSYLHPARLAEADVRDPLLAAFSGAATMRMLGSGSIELAYVAAGRLGIWAQLDCPAWDWLPGAALVTAAGGVTDVLEH